MIHFGGMSSLCPVTTTSNGVRNRRTNVSRHQGTLLVLVPQNPFIVIEAKEGYLTYWEGRFDRSNTHHYQVWVVEGFTEYIKVSNYWSCLNRGVKTPFIFVVFCFEHREHPFHPEQIKLVLPSKEADQYLEDLIRLQLFHFIT